MKLVIPLNCPECGYEWEAVHLGIRACGYVVICPACHAEIVPECEANDVTLISPA